MTDARRAPPRVLVVEDDEDVRATMAEMLRESGYEVVTAPNGWQALRLLRENADCALIVLDLFMPVMDGWQFRDEQKRDAALAAIPVLAVSARGFQAPPIDATAFLAKPMHLQELRDVVARLCPGGQDSK